MIAWALVFSFAAAEPAAPAETTATAPGCACERIGRTEGIVSLGAGIGLGVTSILAFSAGLEAERQMRAGETATREQQADALTQRAVAAWVAWPSAVLSAAGVIGGGWILSEQGE